MIRVKSKSKRPNYFITNDEVSILWTESKRWSTKFQLIVAFGLFRGLRIGEILAININDFEADYSKLRLIIEKSHIEDKLPLPGFLTELVKDYILHNKHTFKDGYLFPYYSSKQHAPHMTVKTAEAMFCSFRNRISVKHAFFKDLAREDGKKRYRITWHSLRRWFETQIYENLQDRKKLADIMRYLKVDTVDTYIDPYLVWKEERNILQASFDSQSLAFQQREVGQTALSQF